MNPTAANWKQVNQMQISVLASVANWAGGHIMTSLLNCLVQCKSRLKPELSPDPILAKMAISLFSYPQCHGKVLGSTMHFVYAQFQTLNTFCGWNVSPV